MAIRSQNVVSVVTMDILCFVSCEPLVDDETCSLKYVIALASGAGKRDNKWQFVVIEDSLHGDRVKMAMRPRFGSRSMG